VPTRIPSLRKPPIAFAHRGARAHAPENTIEAFQLGVRLGATGLESDVWLTADGVAVLDHDGEVGGRLRKRPIGSTGRADLPGHIPTLEELYQAVGSEIDLSLDVKDAAAFDQVIAVARNAGAGALARLWLCHWDWQLLATWRQACDEVRLVDSTRLGRMRDGPERRAAQLRDAGIDAVNLHHSEWTGGLTTLFHRFERLAFGWDAQFERTLDAVLDVGIDAVYSDHVDRMMAALAEAQR
jgi:glycerophosphoryl diester phosphodiesterase